MATKKKATYMKVYGRPGTENGWHFLTADEATIKKIAATVGFKYRWDEKNKEWAHASAATILSPEGKITHYLHGIIFEPKDVKLALMDAVGGKTGSIADRLIWFCYHYDASKSKYSIMASRLMQVGGALCILILAAFLVPFWIRSRKESA
jgi:protein SCO1